MLRTASITHRIPGRVRIRIPSAKADPDFLEQARAALRSLPGVVEVSCNPLTGSLLVLHSPQTALNLESAPALGNGSALPFVIEAAPSKPHPARRRRRRRESSPPSELSQVIVDVVAELDAIVRESTGNAVDLKVLLPIVAAALGITLIGGGRRTPVWLTLLMFAFSSFMSLHIPAETLAEEIAEELP